MKRTMLLIGAAVLALSGCATQSDEAWQLKKSKPEAMQACLAQAKYWGRGQRSEVAGYMNVSEERAPQLFCQRLTDAVASGRITNKDVAQFKTSGSGKLFQIVKGR